MSDNEGFRYLAGRWSSRGMRAVLGVAITLLALLLSWAALLNIIIRDIPEPSSVAEDLVTDLAIGIGIDEDQALEVAEQVITRLDGSYLDASLDTADDIRLGILALPWILLALIVLILLITPSGWRRRRWLGWTLMLSGGSLVLLAEFMRLDAETESSRSYDPTIMDTAREFIGNLLAPAWPIGLIAAGVGFALWLWGVVDLARGEGPKPTES